MAGVRSFEMSQHHESWEKFLNPETLRGNLIGIALFISAYEMFKDKVVEKPVYFFSDTFDKDGPVTGEEYRAEVLSLSKNRLEASLLWFQQMEALDQADMDSFHRIRKHRNELTHEMVEFLSDSRKSLDVELFQSLIALLTKVEKWWFENFELGVDPDILPAGANPADVIPGPVWSLQLMLDIALGNEPEEGHYFNEYRKRKT